MTDEQVNTMPRTEHDFRDYVAQSLRDGRERMDRIESDVRSNTDITAAMKADTQDVLDILNAVKGGLKVLGWLGTAMKWIATVGGAVATVWGLVTGKIPLPPAGK